ncbi:hypothetical protein Tco_1401822 [Tanacetum coccineum]
MYLVVRIRGNRDCERGYLSADAGCSADGLRKRPIADRVRLAIPGSCQCSSGLNLSPLGFIFFSSMMGTIDSLKSILTQSALDGLCEKYYIADELYPELPGPNARIRRSTTGKIGLFVIAAAKISHFEILYHVHCFVPTVGNFHSGITLRKDPPPTPDEFSAEVCDFLVDNPTLFKKFLKDFLCLVGISRYYTLDENCYPTFWDDEDEDMDLFAFIHHKDPTKVKVGEMEIREGEVPLLELTKDRVVLLAGIYNQGNAAAMGVGLSPKKLRGITVPLGMPMLLLPENIFAALQDLLDKSTLAAEIGATTASIVPFVTSFVTPTLEHEGGEYADSVSTANVRTKRPAERFVISSYTPNDSNANAIDDEVSLVVKSTIPRYTVLVPFVLTATIATTVVAGTSIPQPKESFYVSLDMDFEALHQAYVPKWDVLNDSLLDDPNFNVGTTRQISLSAEVRMRLEYVLRGKKRLEGRCDMHEKLLNEKDVEIADLKARLSLKEAEAVETIRLRGQIANVEAAEAAQACELESLKERNLSCDDLGIKASTFKCGKDKLINQVSVLEAICFGLCEEVSGYKLFKERVKEMHDTQVKDLSDRIAGMDYDLMALALYMDEDFYPRYLTTLAGRRWFLSYDVKLVIMKYLQSFEYMTALCGAIGRAIEKGMQDGLVAGIDHGQADASIVDIIELLHLEGSAAETLKGSQLQPSPKQLMVPIHRLEDQVVIGETSLSYSLEVAHNHVRRLRGDATTFCLSLTDAMVPLVEPLSVRSLTGEVSTSGVPAVTTALSTTFSQASIILLEPSSILLPSPRIVSEQ